VVPSAASSSQPGTTVITLPLQGTSSNVPESLRRVSVTSCVARVRSGSWRGAYTGKPVADC
jgi:hypothetical protein